MHYLNFDKEVLTNLEKSLTKEMLRTNRSGAYNSTTLVDCNTRKYHGQLVIPLPNLDTDNHVLLSSLDETIIQHQAEFNLGVHQYEGGVVSPNGHKYIREFTCEVISKTVYRVGGVIISKERLMVGYDEPRTITKYTLLEAHSATTLRFRPFLAFRSVNTLSKENPHANTGYEECQHGIRCRMYETYPYLYMQFSKPVSYQHEPFWYKNIAYYKEQERGYDYLEDLLVPGYFEMPVKKGESIYFTAGLAELSPRRLKNLWDKQLALRSPRTNMFQCLSNAARQFQKQTTEGNFLLAGYPWFHTRARDEFISLPGTKLCIGRKEQFEAIMETAIREIHRMMQGEHSTCIEELDAPDALLWFIWAVQQYGIYIGEEKMRKRYTNIVWDILSYIQKHHHPRLSIHNDQLLYTDGRELPASWMNVCEDGRLVTPRSGLLVELNALWYNALCFAAHLSELNQDEVQYKVWSKQAEAVGVAFSNRFWNGLYLYDYIDGNENNPEVRPNMIFAVSLPYSPLNRRQQKSIVDVCTRELLTTKGLRSLSPKSGNYRPNYAGNMRQRNLNYHNGPVWPWLTGAYCEAYLRIHKQSGISFLERLMTGMEAEMKKLCVGTLSELYDGNPPYKGHGAISFAPTVAEILRSLTMLKKWSEGE